ncbi:MAG TPA: ribonuclease III [Candidatus Krumholzibacteria bacterium]|nr:ribonuclease III [Candidatus Krumholzibacteria bacterium]HRX50700.1 ribonuclease III [Candidatus Krumholzibacteria bacterium]
MGLRDVLQRWLGHPRDSGPGDDASAAPPDGVSRRLLPTLAAVESAVGYTFRDRTLLHRALVHRSHAHAAGLDRHESNERLEFLGDSILGLVVSEDLYRRHGEREEGDLTKMKARLVCGATLGRVARDLGLGDHVLMSKGEEATGGRARASILADVVEAILGAIYLDGGHDAAQAAVRRWILDRADLQPTDARLGNNKSRLQEVVQARMKSPPQYRVLSVTGPDHERGFHVEVRVAGQSLGEGRGPSKKAAEQKAAGQALERLESDSALFGPTEETTDA